MTRLCSNYGKVLSELTVPSEDVEETKQLLHSQKELVLILDSRMVSLTEKHRVIDRIFPDSMQNFLKVICDYHSISFATDMDEIFTVYETCLREKKNILQAVLSYVIAPTPEQLSGIKDFMKRKYQGKEITLICDEDKQLIGGFKIKVEDMEYDWSIQGKMKRLQQKLTGR